MEKKEKKNYDLIIVGTGSATNLLEPLIEHNPKIKIAIIDKDETGGICLTRGCIPSKILLYPAELVRDIERARDLGVEAEISKIDFQKIMNRMRSLIGNDIESIRRGLSSSENIDYYQSVAEFVSPYTMKVGSGDNETIISSKMFFLCLGSKTIIPPIKGLEEAGYITSDTILKLTTLPKSVVVAGGGYIAAEYGHFLSSMGSDVTIVGRNPKFLPEEEPEVSELVKGEMQKHIQVITNHEVREANKTKNGTKRVTAFDRQSGKKKEIEAEEIMIAAGRGPLTDILHPERGGVKTTKDGWIQVNEYLETSQPNVWSFGDAKGRYMFRHVANYESEIAYYNAILKQRIKADYHAIPHAVFTYPEVASVGMGEKEAVEKFGSDKVLIGFYKYENTAKGEAMNVKNYFVKVILDADQKILGAHIVGPEASVLIQEIINVMYAPTQNAEIINRAIHIHPALSEVVQRAFSSLMPVEHYHEHVLAEKKKD
ncbi:MAG TPA: dihydrolipoyl dehydrogenase [Nitrososphaerales archaeon]|nr:dihydrolipoyl dehydrogenase [Nitrososphaerales archaeon]